MAMTPQQTSPPRVVPILVVLLCAFPSLRFGITSNTVTPSSYETFTSDGLAFRVSAELLLLGRSPYDLGVQAEHIARTRLGGAAPAYRLPFAYPPNALPLFLLYAIGPPRLGCVIFVFLGALLMLLALHRLTGVYGYAPTDRLLILMGVGAGGATMLSAQLGQTGAYQAALAFAYVASYEKSDARSGLFLGLLAFKPQYALYLAVLPLVTGRFRLLGYAALSCAATALLSGALFGFGLWTDFLRAVVRPNWTAAWMANWFALALHLSAGRSLLSPRLGIPVMLTGAALLVPLFLLVKRRGGDALAALGLATACAVLEGPNTHPYDLMLWTLPILSLLRPGALLPAWVAVGLAGIAVRLFTPADDRVWLALMSLSLVSLCLWRPGKAAIVIVSPAAP